MSKAKIAIVGAGPAGLSTAFFLTDPATNPGWADRYEVDIYQLGWRVGGKGATGRNIDACERVQEHGIHVFGNMYFNSLRMMQSCYQELAWDEHDCNRTMDEAFQPSTLTLMTDYFDATWHRDVERFPDNRGRPWLNNVWPKAHGITVEVLNMVSRRLSRMIEWRDHPERRLAAPHHRERRSPRRRRTDAYRHRDQRSDHPGRASRRAESRRTRRSAEPAR